MTTTTTRLAVPGESARVIRHMGQARLQSTIDDALLVIHGTYGWMNAKSARWNGRRFGLQVEGK